MYLPCDRKKDDCLSGICYARRRIGVRRKSVCIYREERSRKDNTYAVSYTHLVSSVASAQPKVKLGMTQGQTFYLKDLLYSLMLESHNDSAVAIAECIAGNVDKFADMMNKKASQDVYKRQMQDLTFQVQGILQL